jgi:uncharacterized membrane protein YfhO
VSKADVRSVALVFQEDLPPGLRPSGYDVSRNSVSRLRYDANAVHVDLRAEREGILVCSDTFLTGWRAYADGKEVALFRVNGKFRGVAVPSGTTSLVFTYSAPGFGTGLVISVITVGGLVALCILERVRRGHASRSRP